MGAEDFNGMPWADREKGLRLEMMAALKEANAAPRAIINLDELSNVPRSTQSAMLRFIHTRRCGDYVLGPHVRMGGAMNPTSSAADAQEISLPMGNRICWLPWLKVTAMEHASFITGGGRDTPLELPEKPTPEQEDEAFRYTSAVYAGFMHRRGVLDEDPEKDERILARSPLAWATPRSWEAFIRVAATCHIFGDVEAMQTIGEGLVGPAQALEFMAFYTDSDLPDPEDWLKDPHHFKHDAKRPDRTFAAVTQLALAAVDKDRTAAMKDGDKTARWNAAMNALVAISETASDKTVLALGGQTLAINRPKGALLATYQKFINEVLAPIIRAAGFTTASKN
jgi:hypothetical protein